MRDICSPNSHDPYYPVRTAIRFIRSLSVPRCARIFDLLSYASSQPRTWSVAAMWLILVGVLGAAAAAIFGTLDLLNLGSYAGWAPRPHSRPPMNQDQKINEG